MCEEETNRLACGAVDRGEGGLCRQGGYILNAATGVKRCARVLSRERGIEELNDAQRRVIQFSRLLLAEREGAPRRRMKAGSGTTVGDGIALPRGNPWRPRLLALLPNPQSCNHNAKAAFEGAPPHLRSRVSGGETNPAGAYMGGSRGGF
jgi:hypothetical protein